MACNSWRNAWKDREFAIALQDSAIWKAYRYLSRPHQIAVAILECLAEATEPLSYAEIGERIGIDKVTVSQCLNCLAKAGYPVELKRTAKIANGRPPRRAQVGALEKFSTPPDCSWMYELEEN